MQNFPLDCTFAGTMQRTGHNNGSEFAMKRLYILFTVATALCFNAYGQDAAHVQSDSVTSDGKPQLKQQPGLALAASKIFFTDKRYSISGFGEFNYVPLQSDINTDIGDLELYYSGLYRYATFFGYKITDKLIWNSELQVELLHYKTEEVHPEFVIEAFFDYLFKDYLKLRVGYYPLTIGYVNNNDEPVMFYSVNRSEVERLIIPSTWIEFGVMFYGNISPDWSYAMGFSQGLNSRQFLSGSWIRQGREIRFSTPDAIAFNPQINYTGIKHLTLSASGYWGNSGQGEKIFRNQDITEVKGNIRLLSAYAKYDWANFRFVAVGTQGWLGDTDGIYELTKNEDGSGGQVLGRAVNGYLAELGCDILPYFRNKEQFRPKKGLLYDTREMKLSIFSRYERLNTHHSVHPSLASLPRNESNMDIITAGINFNSREHVVLKANYQYRMNRYPGNPVKHIIETGVGFIF